MVKRKQYIVGTTISRSEHDWILKRVDEGKAINRADLLRMALRVYMEIEKEKEREIERMRLRQAVGPGDEE